MPRLRPDDSWIRDVPHDAWTRLGEELERARIALDPQFSNRNEFTRQRGINARLAQDLETAARHSYLRKSLTLAEVAYGLAPGSIRRFLQHGTPLEAGDPRKLEILDRARYLGQGAARAVPDES